MLVIISSASACVSLSVIHASCCLSPGFIGKITLQIPFYRPHSDPWVISMSQLNLIIGPTQLQEYDVEKEREEERQRKKRLLKALEDKFIVGGSMLQIKKKCFFVCLTNVNKEQITQPHRNTRVATDTHHFFVLHVISSIHTNTIEVCT